MNSPTQKTSENSNPTLRGPSQPANDLGSDKSVAAHSPRAFHPLVAVGLVVAVYFFAVALAGFIVSLYPVLKHWTPAHSQAWLDNIDNLVWPQFIYTVLAYGALLAPILYLLKRRGFRLGDIGLKRPRLRDPFYGLVAYLIYYVVSAILLVVVSSAVPSLDTGQKQQIGFNGASGAGPLILTFLSLAIIPPLAEEIIVRGFLFTNLRMRLRWWPAVLVTSLVFAAGHLQFGSGAPLLWVAAIDTFALSLFLIYLRVKTGSLWAGIFLHALKNTLAFVVIFILHKG